MASGTCELCGGSWCDATRWDPAESCDCDPNDPEVLAKLADIAERDDARREDAADRAREERF